MTDTSILTQMIQEAALVSLEGGIQRPRVILREPQAPDSFATISSLPSDAFVIRVEAFKAPDSVFKGSKGECKRADFIIISEKKKSIVYIEMKRNKKGGKHVAEQLTGAQCFVGYCREVGRAYWHERNFLNQYRHRFVSIGHASISKRKTRITPNGGVHDSPQKALKVDWPKNIQFNLLAGI